MTTCPKVYSFSIEALRHLLHQTPADLLSDTKILAAKHLSPEVAEWGLHASDLFGRQVLHLRHWIEIWRIERPSQQLKLVVPLLKPFHPFLLVWQDPQRLAVFLECWHVFSSIYQFVKETAQTAFGHLWFFTDHTKQRFFETQF
ncbi:hypothetical protein CHARACLAT_003502 [Characodon lateralis]|uniref:Uncharacterized protein n=1 Tax=Characodon lateralis TaxID=208331 RepID=A0ABU7E6S5_9TELE|nr:hypothetical protein [Characodon lateralis]